ncbi:hypothetical protein SSBR45G_03070 [Bradyrhizobium sp. SSBR45G]|uniref:hypothetical protein n=1 Tax=unclassified Bradyrhizobium TaxID=2631580 RepID=UPI00234295B6|nr:MULTISPECIES: hypothetical protein [unclassified Bradyrhizobium]GLH75399.1 hypothetical protein SSBR45G_03070 [Bradyrhizobium sp. SSBR45G]GLH82814.1 hypothetical protein SSBR45R_02740 [Bradyrhizobium sp. SSBR45R]
MLRVIVLFLLMMAAPVTADARQRQINPVPFAHTPCSVLDERPCTPSFCGVYGPWPCIPEMNYPYGQNLQLTIESRPAKDQEAKYQKPDHDLDTIGDLFAALRACWTPPPEGDARAGMQMTVRFSFKRTGEMVAPPRVTFATSGVSAETRATFLKAINASLDACLPLKFTSGLAGALAGRPIAIRYVDNRDLSKTSQQQ